MKQRAPMFWGWIVGISVGMAAVLALPLSQAAETRLSLESVALQFQSPQELAHFMWRQFRFEFDQSQFGREDYWQSPEEMLTNREGDCEDFARFAQAILKRMGKPSLLLSIYGGGFSHMVCVFRQGGRFFVFDGASLRESPARDLKELVSEIYPFWKKAWVVSPLEKLGSVRLLKEISRSV